MLFSLRYWVFALCSVAVECADLVLYDGSHRYNTSRDTEIMASITAPLIGSAWIMGADGEMLRNTGGAWQKFASNKPNESEIPSNLTLYRDASFLGHWAGGTAGQLLQASDWGSGTWRTQATSNRSRPLNAAARIYSPLDSGNWAAGAGTTVARDVGSGWALFAAHDVRYPEREPTALYGAADETADAAPYLGDECVHYGQQGAAGSGPFGGQPLQLAGNTWHSTSYKLYCGGQGRRDFRPYDTLSFYLRYCHDAECTAPEGTSPIDISFQVDTWDAASQQVFVKDYMDGPLDGTWRQVRIPLADLVTDAYDMHSVDHIRWPNMKGGVYYVDAVTLNSIGGDVPGVAPLTANSTIRGMSRSASDEVVAVGDGGVLLQLRKRDLSWQQRALPAAVSDAQTDLLAVWLSSTDAWVVGAASTLLRCPITGGACLVLDGPTDAARTFRGVAGAESTMYVQASAHAPVQNPVQRLDLWVVGTGGTVLHFDGSAWTEQSAGTDVGLHGVFAISTSDVWACGADGVLLHFDGADWSAVQSGTTRTLYSVWAAGATSVWVSGDAGTLIFCEGSSACDSVAVPTSAALYAVAGTREYDVFAVGAGGVAIYKHWSGEWRKAGCEYGAECASISPHGADLFAAAAGGLCVFYGTERVGAGADGGPALELAGDHWHNPALKLYCGGKGRRDFARHNLLAFEIRSPNRTASGVRIASVGAEHATLRLSTWNQRGNTVPIRRYAEGNTIDTAWRRVEIPLADLRCTETCPEATFVFESGRRCCSSNMDQDGNSINFASTTCQGEYAIECPAISEGSACCDNAGHPWLLQNVEEMIIGNASIGCGTPADGRNCHVFQLREVVVVDQASLPTNDRHANEVASSASVTASTIRGMSRSASDEVVAVGDGGVLLQLRKRDLSWQQRALPAAVSDAQTDLLAVWLSSTDAWVVGAASTLLRCPITGGACLVLDGPTDAARTFRGVAGAESTMYVQASAHAPVQNPVQRLDLWVVGTGGTVLHFDGSAWTEQSAGTDVGLHGVFAISTSDVWACGADGVLLHFDGADWSAVQSGTTRTLYSVWAAGATSVWVSGDAGTLIFCEGSSACDSVAVPTSAALYAVAGTREYDVFAVGAGGVAIYKHWSGEWRKAGCEYGAECASISPHGADLFAAAAGGLCVFYGTERVGAGADGGPALELAGDHWHNPALKLYCHAGPRRDLCDYHVMRFQIRRSQDPIEPNSVLYPTVSLSTWDVNGPAVSVADYLETGTHVDDTWRQVTIPLTALTTPTWRLWNVGTVTWGNTSADCGDQKASVLSPSCQQFLVSGLEALQVEGLPPLCAADDALREGVPTRIPKSATNVTIRGVSRALTGSCASPRPMMMVECSRDAQLWACGDAGYLAHTDHVSMEWVVDESPVASALHGIVVLSPTEMWACGDGGIMLNGNGHVWVEWPVPVPSDVRLFAMAALARDQVWAVGDRGTVIFFDGNVWTGRHLDTGRTLRGVSWFPGDDFLGYPLLGVIVGDDGAIYMSRDPAGGGWAAVDHSLSRETLHSVTVPRHTDAWAVGEHGTLLHFDGEDWAWVHSGTDANLYAVEAYRARAVLVAGAGGTILWCVPRLVNRIVASTPLLPIRPGQCPLSPLVPLIVPAFPAHPIQSACGGRLSPTETRRPPLAGIIGVTSSGTPRHPRGPTYLPSPIWGSASSLGGKS